jgi:hypothetical protein
MGKGRLHRAQRSRVYYGVGALTLMAALVLAFGAAPGHTQELRAGSTSTTAGSGGAFKFIGDAFCGIVSGPATGAGKKLLEEKSGGRIKAEGLFSLFLFESLNRACKPVVKKATAALQSLFRHEKRPAQQAGTRAEFRASLRDLSAALVAKQLGYRTARDARFITNQLCSDVASGRSPNPTLARYLPNSNIRNLPSLNGLVSLALRCRTPLNARQLNYLSSAIASFAIENTYRRDFEPPVALVFQPRTTDVYSNGAARVVVDWFGFDSQSNVKAYWVWLYQNGWRFIPQKNLVSADSAYAYVWRGTNFRFAIRAQDTAGNMSGWFYGRWWNIPK